MGVALFVSGCSDASNELGPKGSGSSQTATVSASATASIVAPFDAKAFCERVCKRSRDCSLEAAVLLAKSSDPADKASLEKATSEQAADEAQRRKTCTALPPTGSDIPRAQKAEACLTEKYCAAHKKCFVALAASSQAAP